MKKKRLHTLYEGIIAASTISILLPRTDLVLELCSILQDCGDIFFKADGGEMSDEEIDQLREKFTQTIDRYYPLVKKEGE